MGRILLALLHRSFIKSNRDVVAYGVRIAMYLGLAVMMGTVWLRLETSQDHIQPFINAIVSERDTVKPRHAIVHRYNSSSGQPSCS